MSMSKHYDVLTICNALVDLLYKAEDVDLAQFNLSKACTSLVNTEQQQTILRHFAAQDPTVELGGSSLNAIRALAMLKKKTVFAGMLGNDHYGYTIRKRLEDLNIKGDLHTTDKDATGTCLILVTPDGERTLNTHLGASHLYTREIIPTEDLEASRILHLSGYQWDTDEQKEAVMIAMQIAKKASCEISLDLADPFVVQHNRDALTQVIRDYADIVFANEQEASLLYGTSPEETAKRIADTGAIAVVKLGARGALVQKGSQLVKIAPVATKVVDTTGAGDMFAAGFLYGHLSNLSLEECGNIAALLASDVISRFGATLSDSVIAAVLGRGLTKGRAVHLVR